MSKLLPSLNSPIIFVDNLNTTPILFFNGHLHIPSRELEKFTFISLLY